MTVVTDKSSHGRGTRPPWWPLAVSACALAISIYLLRRPPPAEDPFTIHRIGWGLSAWVPMACLVAYRLRVRKLSRRGDFTTTSVGGRPVVIASVAGVLVGLWHGYFVALWWVSG